MMSVFSDRPRHKGQKGVALAVLLWFIAALAIMVAGIVLAARVDVKLAQQQTQQAKARALGDGVVNLMMRHTLRLQQEGEYDPLGLLVANFSMGEQAVSARVVPASGLFALNQATPEVWARLLEYALDNDGAQVEQLLANIEEWRQPPTETATPENPLRRSSFAVVEDILLVPGMTRDILERIRPLVHALPGGQGVALRAAPPEVIRLLTGSEENTLQFLAEREANAANIDAGYATIPPELVGMGGGSAYVRVDVRMQQPDGTVLQYSRWVQPGVAGRDGLPWRRLRAEPVIVVNSLDF